MIHLLWKRLQKEEITAGSAEIADESHVVLRVHLCARACVCVHVCILCFQLLQFEDMHRLCVTGCTEEVAFRTEGQRADTDIPADTNPTRTKCIRITTKAVTFSLMHGSAAVTALCVSDVSGPIITATDHV